ncbi:MAG: hypothetical protein AB7P04_12665 [Bacteriovoracia bacterium]
MRILRRLIAFGGLGAVGFLAATGPFASAAEFGGVQYTVKPIIGYDRVYKDTPTPHTYNRLTYGVNAAATYSFLSLELEYTHGAGTETFPASGETVSDTAEKIKLGLKGTYQMGSVFSASLRGGGQISKVKTVTTVGTSVSTSYSPTQIDPYFGLGTSLRVAEKNSADFGVTVVFRSFPSLHQAEWQFTGGYAIHL